MIPIVFINCASAPFVDEIASGRKKYETRSRDMLRALAGERILIAETGRGRRPVVRLSAVLGKPIAVNKWWKWNELRPKTRVVPYSPYDWNGETKKKYLYPISQVEPVEPFTPPDGVRHGRVWMEYNP